MKFKIITWLLIYFIAMLVLAFLISCFEIFVVLTETVEPTEYNMFINQVLVEGQAVNKFQQVLIIIYSVYFLTIIYPISIFIKTLKYFEKNIFFNPVIYGNLKKIGYFFLLITVPVVITEGVFYFYNMVVFEKPILFFINPFAFMGTSILIGLLFLFISDLLSKIQKHQEENKVLKEENELTI